jgi:predicted metal-dependent peptidase
MSLERVQKARTQLVLSQPFFGVLALRLHLMEDASLPTMATDGTSILFNPTFVESLTQKQLQGVLAHEVMHCACGHPWRRDNRDPLKWNLTADYAINPIVTEAGLELPKGALKDTRFTGKSAEWIYDRLPPIQTITIAFGAGGDEIKDGATAPQTIARGEGTAGEGGEASGQTPEPLTEADWQQAVQQVAAAEKTRGTLPVNIERMVGLVSQARVDWRSVLRRFIQESSKADYQWTRPNSRHLSQGLYMPGLYSQAMGPMAVAIDTSGSIDQVLLSQFASELNAIADEVSPERVHVVYCDAEIQREDVFERGETVVLKPRGGGGTAFEPVMDWADALDETPVCLVYLTDLYGSFGTAPQMPVLWATPSRGVDVPYGDVVTIA